MGKTRKYHANIHIVHYGSGLPVFRGDVYQQGYGLGGLLSGLFRAVIPIFKPLAKAAIKRSVPMLKRGAKELGKTALSATSNILSDAIQHKRPIRESVKHHARKSAGELLNKIIQNEQKPFVTKKARKRKAPKNRKQDIFQQGNKRLRHL
jgi:hypothetical protein